MIPMWSQQKRAMAHHPSDHSGFDLERKKPTKVERHQNHLPRTMPTKARSYIWYNADIQGERERERSSSDRPSACQTVWQTRTTTRRDHTPDDNQRGMEQGRPKGNEPVRKTVPTLAVFVHNLLLCVAPASFVTAPPAVSAMSISGTTIAMFCLSSNYHGTTPAARLHFERWAS